MEKLIGGRVCAVPQKKVVDMLAYFIGGLSPSNKMGELIFNPAKDGTISIKLEDAS
jgi:hypothetical protein